LRGEDGGESGRGRWVECLREVHGGEGRKGARIGVIEKDSGLNGAGGVSRSVRWRVGEPEFIILLDVEVAFQGVRKRCVRRPRPTLQSYLQ
jgi:hypothetical protein